VIFRKVSTIITYRSSNSRVSRQWRANFPSIIVERGQKLVSFTGQVNMQVDMAAKDSFIKEILAMSEIAVTQQILLLDLF
jgi:hypothetical protein